MQYHKLGASDMNLSALSIGTWAIGGANWGETDRTSSIRAMHAMFDNGVNSVDTAPAYNFGESERIVGEAVRGRRDKVYLTTKTGVYNTKEVPFVKDARYETVIRLCEQSLKNLQTDYIDLMLIHWPDTEHCAPFDETMRALEELVQAGKLRYIGVSNFSQEQITEIQKFGQIVAIEPPYSMVNRSQEALMQWCAGRGIGTMTYGSLGAGILTGAYRTLPKFEEGDMRVTFYDYFREPKFSRIQKLLLVMDDIAKAHHATPAQVAVNGNAQKPFVTTSLCGVRSEHHAIEDCMGFEWSLTDQEMQCLDAAIGEYIPE